MTNPPDAHAFPDHEVMRAAFEGIENRRLTKETAIAVIKGDPAWMPVAVDPGEGLVYFVNVGQRSLDRWQFVYSLRALADEDDPAPTSFSVSFDVLQSLEPA